VIQAAGLVLLLVPLAGGGDAGPAPAPRDVERSIAAGGGGRVAVRLDREVYEAAREDLGDLRVLDEDGRLVPFLLDRGERPGPRSELRAEVRNRAYRPDGAATAVLDLGGRVRKTRLRLELSGDNFRRRVAVEASDDGAAWSTIADEAWLFAVPGPEPARYETLALPENDFPLLRVTVHPGEDERGRVRVDGAVLPAAGEPPRLEERLRPRWSRAEDTGGRETWLNVELGARHQPFHALELEVGDGRFFREARVEARRDAGPGRPLYWVEIGRGEIHRLEHDGRSRERCRLDVAGRERALRVRLRNGDDRPLDVRGVALRVPVERVVFEAAPGRRYRLAYGSGAPRPAFDLARTVADLPAWAAGASDVPLGPPRLGPARAAAEPPWSERHPALLWGGLLAVVAVLGALTLRALRQAAG
jgi:hypothetical protein